MSSVQQINLNDGHSMPMVGFGTYEATGADIRVAIRAGYRLFDGADFYGNEAEVGAALRAAIAAGEVIRDQLFVVSKVWPNWLAAGRPTLSAERTLQNLGLDYVDLLLIHWPTPFKQVDDDYHPGASDGQVLFDESIELADVWREFELIKQKGLTRSIGVSNFNARQIQDLIDKSSTVPAVLQVESHPYFANTQLLRFCQQKGIAFIGYSPLATTGPNKSLVPPIQLPLIRELAKKYGIGDAIVILRWQVQRGVTVIPKSSTPERIAANIRLFDFKLTDDEMTAIDGLDRNYRCHPWTHWGIGKHKNYPFSDPF
ncbi:aldo-keto reductase family 1 member A1-like [Oppia nitens]|uniref:aldo-keto reductase family 1 member A1-like n=1 Tax=Oppia nitens TaxID=1686743 RepID=UPI0023DC50C5|nr:aldo-keto reductase family 1 member A1-like [Oppia nitens]